MDELTVRRVKDGDEEEWLRMRIALWPACSLLLEELRAIAAQPEKTPVFVVERTNGRLGGFLEASLRSTAHGCTTSPVAYIEGWYVDPDLRRLGLGNRLVAAMEAWARSAGCREIASDCILENETSLRAHLALGYTEEGRLIHFRKVLHGHGGGGMR